MPAVSFVDIDPKMAARAIHVPSLVQAPLKARSVHHAQNITLAINL